MRELGRRAGLLCIATLVCLWTAQSAAFGQTPGVYVQYQIWYSRGECPTDRPQVTWAHWSWWSSVDDPCTVATGLPWMRNISSPGYPLIGPYASDSPHLLRWHMRLAKAAGIDGFLVSVFPAIEPAFFRRFELMLRIAVQENFKIGLEGWTPDSAARVGPWRAETMRYIDHFANQSPHRKALLRIDGKPVFWFNFSARTQAIDEIAAFFDSVEALWIFSGVMSLDEERELNSRLTRSAAVRQIDYNFPTEQGFDVNQNFRREVRNKLEHGLYAFSHGFPGYDEQVISNKKERTRRYGLRNDGQTLRDYLRSARDSGAHGVIVSSWNEWAEMSVIEPGFDALFRAAEPREEVYGSDPYAVLKIIAEFTGVAWKAPDLPCHIVDRLLIKHRILRCRPL